MKKVLALGFIAILLFVLSAGGSLFLQQWRQGKVELGNGPPPPGPGFGSDPGKPAREPVEVKTKRPEQIEKKIAERMRAMYFIKKDLDGEMEKTEKQQTELEKLFKKANDKAAEVEQKNKDLRKREDENKKKEFEIKELEGYNIKQLAERFNRMESAAAAEGIRQMIADKKIADAARLLSEMGERQGAKVLEELVKTKTHLPVQFSQLVEILKGLKRPAEPGTTGEKEVIPPGGG